MENGAQCCIEFTVSSSESTYIDIYRQSRTVVQLINCSTGFQTLFDNGVKGGSCHSHTPITIIMSKKNKKYRYNLKVQVQKLHDCIYQE